MRYRGVIIPVILLFFSGVVLFSFLFGPANRRFVAPEKSVKVQLAKELDYIWHTSNVHGRIAVIFARHLKQNLSGNTFPEMDYLESTMRHGIVRGAYFIVSDSVWSEVIREHLTQPLKIPLRPTDYGFMLLNEYGRIHVMPLSKFIPEGNEKVLTVLDPAVWSTQERFKISNMLNSGLLKTDLLITVDSWK